MSIVSANYFDALGVRPILGRGFEPAEDSGRNAHPVTVISYQMWKERFHGDPAIIGKTQMLNGMPHTIIGVAPEGFYGTFVGWAMQFWVPVSMQERFDPGGYKLEDRGARWIEGFVRLKPGVTPEQAQAEISAVAKRLENDYPATNRGRGVRLFPLWKTPFNNAGTLFPTLSVALAVVSFVLLIACANVGNLLLVRAFGRRHEMTVRLAIGAGRGRLLKQLLTEGLILSTLAAGGGLLLANWCRNLLPLLLPARGGVTMRLPGEIDWRVLALSAGVCLISTVFFGLVPAMQSSKIDLVSALKAESGGVVGGRRRAVLRWSLVVVQVSLSFVLLVGAGLLLKSLRAIQNTSPGFSTHERADTGVDLVAAGYDTQRIKNFQDALIDRLSGAGWRAIGGVRANDAVQLSRLFFRSHRGGWLRNRAATSSPRWITTKWVPGYFATMGIPMVAGREFTRADNETARPVAVVNEAMAAQYWRGRDPVGSRLQVKGRWLQVVGIAKMSKYRKLSETPKPFFYVAMRQNSNGSNFYIRTSLAPEAMTKALVREIHALDANLAPGEVITHAGTSGPDHRGAAGGRDDARRVWRIGGGAGRHRTIRRDVVHGVAENAGTGVADGAGRGRIESDAAGDVARPGVDGRRRGAGPGGGAWNDAADGKPAVSGEPSRSTGVRVGVGGDDDRVASGVFPAGVARDADGSGAGVARLMAAAGSRLPQLPSRLPAWMPPACASSPPLTFLPSSSLAFSTSIRPPWAVTLKL